MNLDVMAIIQEFAVVPVAIVCLLLGAYLKNHLPEFPNRFIPLVLTAVGLVGVLWFKGWAFTPENVLSGICSASLAVYLHQNGKHLFTSHGSPENEDGLDDEHDEAVDGGDDELD